ncbi:serine/threonine-protein phosphatase 7 long form-like protein [Trifolium medium]|uniref:Serine/threonine-protein phosphatase 7 long form-like protein n=1 Tax=Trifolium medium TaxID=97028 RepID=A0A392MI02_9FABA|nr:serine/threonine-protein phosphatase 7 long form-like protein [Trifolium medium]
MVDPHPISAFVERWHPETSSFHMSFGEMTITLDDVACLLYLPIRGDFYTPLSVTLEEAAALAAELLGVSYEFALHETAKAYMLMLVGHTILTDKSYTRVDAKWLPMFRVLSTCDRFSWVSAALVCLYDNLNDAYVFTTKGLSGYATLLQCWIHEYFPNLGKRAESGVDCDDPDASFPRAMW